MFIGGSLGLGVLVTVFAAEGSSTLSARELLAHRVATSLTAGTAMLALVLVIGLIVVPGKTAQVTTNATVGQQSPSSDNQTLPAP